MPTVDSSTSIANSNILRELSCRNSIDRISVTAEPSSVSSFRKRAKSSSTKLPPKVSTLPPGDTTIAAAVQTRKKIARPVTVLVTRCAVVGADHQQDHGANAEQHLRHHREQQVTCGRKAHDRGPCALYRAHWTSAAAFTAEIAVW